MNMSTSLSCKFLASFLQRRFCGSVKSLFSLRIAALKEACIYSLSTFSLRRLFCGYVLSGQVVLIYLLYNCVMLRYTNVDFSV